MCIKFELFTITISVSVNMTSPVKRKLIAFANLETAIEGNINQISVSEMRFA